MVVMVDGFRFEVNISFCSLFRIDEMVINLTFFFSSCFPFYIHDFK